VQLTAWLPGPLVSGRPTIGGGAWRTADETTPYGLHDRDVGFVEVPAEPERHRNDEGRHATVTVATVHLKNVRVRCGASRKGVKQCPTRPYSAIAADLCAFPKRVGTVCEGHIRSFGIPGRDADSDTHLLGQTVIPAIALGHGSCSRPQHLRVPERRYASLTRRKAFPLNEGYLNQRPTQLCGTTWAPTGNDSAAG
jgi:hypothetical protein